MLASFGKKLNRSSMQKGCKKKWDWEAYHIWYVDVYLNFFWCSWNHSCLAHVINLATQALISTYSCLKHFNPHDPEAHEPAVEEEGQRDEVGLIRTITVKVSFLMIYRYSHLIPDISTGSLINKAEGNAAPTADLCKQVSPCPPHRHEGSLVINICHA